MVLTATATTRPRSCSTSWRTSTRRSSADFVVVTANLLGFAHRYLFLDVGAEHLTKLQRKVTAEVNTLLGHIRQQFGGSRVRCSLIGPVSQTVSLTPRLIALARQHLRDSLAYIHAAAKEQPRHVLGAPARVGVRLRDAGERGACPAHRGYGRALARCVSTSRCVHKVHKTHSHITFDMQRWCTY